MPQRSELQDGRSDVLDDGQSPGQLASCRRSSALELPHYLARTKKAKS